MKKYELIPQENSALFRIKALIDFSNVKAGDLGGFVEGEHNLSHEGDCWVFDNARVSGNAYVSGNAHVYGTALVYGNAHVSGNAYVYDNARVYGNAYVYGTALVYGNAHVYGDAHVKETQWIRFGHYKRNSLIDLLRCSLGVHASEDGYITVYKRVNKDYSSEHDRYFVYPAEGCVEAKEWNADPSVSCGAGLHFSTNEYWPLEDEDSQRILIAKVHLDDIIACQEGKIRVKRAIIK